MIYTVVVDVVIYVAIAVTCYFAIADPYNYIIGALLVLGAITKCFYLRELIEEIREAQPVRKSRKKKTNNKARIAATVSLMEVIAATALYILYSNGITLAWPVIALSCLMALIIGLYMSL